MTIETIKPEQYPSIKRGIIIGQMIDTDIVRGSRYKVEAVSYNRRMSYNDFATIEESFTEAERLLGIHQKLKVYFVVLDGWTPPPDKALEIGKAIQDFIIAEKGNYERTRDGEFNEFAVPQLLKRLGVLIGL